MTGLNLCYALAILSEAVIAWLYLEYLFPRRSNLIISSCTFFVGYMALFSISLLHNPVANIASFFLVTWVLILINYHCKLKISLIHVALLTFLMTVTDVFSNLFIGIFGHEFAEFTQTLAAAVPMAVISKLLYLLLSIFVSRLFKPQKHQHDEPKRILLLCVFPIISVGIGTLICYLGMHTQLNDATQIMIVVNMLSLLIMNLIFLVLYTHLQTANEERTALQLSLQKEEANAAYYRASQEQSETHRVLLHDIKKHFSVIQTLAQEGRVGNISSYISELEYHFFATVEVPRMSSDPILNSILLHTVRSCKDQQITFDCDVRTGCTASLDAIAITALYGNLLSNAVESAAKSVERRIEFSAICNQTQNSVTISVVNSCDAPPTPDGKGSWLSAKKTVGLHGMGLKSIARVLQKYNGVSKFYYDAEQHLFHHIVQLPLQPQTLDKV